ncbi:IS4/Tn5 family transposase DNA-binding protein [Bradyrhizobium sp. USDA 3311]
MRLTLRDRSTKGCLRSLDGECWIDRESNGCEFRDARLGDRFRKLLTQIGSAMGQSIPLVCQDWANTKAAYRFFSNVTGMRPPPSHPSACARYSLA